jgi:L-ribulokinase
VITSPFILSDQKDLASFKRSRCAAGHKAMWHESWGGLPSKEFLKIRPSLAELRDRLYENLYFRRNCRKSKRRMG